MVYLFYLNMIIALSATAMAITRTNAVHSLLYFIASLLSVAVLFFLAGAPFAAVLEVIVYAGAIIVLLLFVVMMIGNREFKGSRKALGRARLSDAGPLALAAVIVAELLYIMHNAAGTVAGTVSGPKEVGASLFANYLIGIELASVLLIVALIGVFHLGRCILGGKEDSDDTGTG
jgi:NADH-quinone oxidoreductase subunit J